MDRQEVYVGQIPQDTDILLTNKNAMIGSGWIAQSVMGTGTLFYGLGCTPTSPATLTVNVAPGCVFSQQNIDNSAYGSLASDTSHQIVKVGINKGTLNFSCPAPVTSGQSVVYLIQSAFVESDTGTTVLPYYNAANPATPWAGPNNTGVSQNTIRQDLCSITIKTGVAATTGTQVTPAPDVGFTGLWAITVANGQSTVTSGNIALVSGAPFITESLTQKISQTTADARYAQISAVQTDALDFALDTGSTNALIAALNPAVTALTQGMSIVLTVAHNNNGASTLNLNGLGAKNITNKGNALIGGELAAGQNAALSYNGSTWNLMSSAANLSQLYTGSASTTGAANAQVLATVTPSGFSLLFGNIVTFTAGFTNTGATTINVSSTGAITIKKKNSGGGLVDLAAGDLVSTDIYQIIYDGTFWELYSLSFPPSSTFFQVANNLSEGVASTMRSNLGLGSAALLASSAVLQTANALSELSSVKTTAQTNLGVRNVLTANATYHVSTTGNDSTGNGSSGSPWLTIQHAVNVVQNTLDLGGFTATISVAAGTYTGATAISGVFNGNLVITGNNTTPSNCIISTTGANCFNVSFGSYVTIGGFQLQTTTSGDCLHANDQGSIIINGAMIFGACAGAHMQATGAGANILNNGGANYTISGNAVQHMSAGVNSEISVAGNTVTLTGTPAFSVAFAAASVNGSLYCPNVTYSGAATGTYYSAQTNGVILTNTGNPTYFPGSISGTTATGGQYV